MPEDGRDRLRGAFKRPPSRGQATAAVLLAIVGFAAVVQVQSTESDDYANLRQEELIQLLDSIGLTQQRTEQELAELETTRDDLRSSTAGDEAALAEARRQAEVLGILAGTIPAVGSGVRITVEDPDAALGTDQLLNGIQELRDAGAEAIEINDSVRVVAQTALAPGESLANVPTYEASQAPDFHALAAAVEQHNDPDPNDPE